MLEVGAYRYNDGFLKEYKKTKTKLGYGGLIFKYKITFSDNTLIYLLNIGGDIFELYDSNKYSLGLFIKFGSYGFFIFEYGSKFTKDEYYKVNGYIFDSSILYNEVLKIKELDFLFRENKYNINLENNNYSFLNINTVLDRKHHDNNSLYVVWTDLRIICGKIDNNLGTIKNYNYILRKNIKKIKKIGSLNICHIDIEPYNNSDEPIILNYNGLYYSIITCYFTFDYLDFMDYFNNDIYF